MAAKKSKTPEAPKVEAKVSKAPDAPKASVKEVSQEPDRAVTCGNCGTKNEFGAITCKQCGYNRLNVTARTGNRVQEYH